MRRVAQAHRAAHVEQALEARAQHLGGHKSQRTRGERRHAGRGRDAEFGEHAGGEHALVFGGGAVHQHRHAVARQQQGQQGREHRQFARTVVAGQHHGGEAVVGHALQAGVGRVEETGHLVRGFALDAHGQAERAGFQVGHAAVEHLAEQVAGLLARERTGASRAAADFLDVVADSHG
ncbi:hypothetical protein D9M69_566140 [compost metagenome]